MPRMRRPDSWSSRPGCVRDHLTCREKQVLACMADGNSIPETGRLLFISHETVKTHLRHIRWALQARNTTNAVAIALRRGLL